MKISEIACPAMQTPVCRMAVITDPDGNKITIHKRHPQVR